jgi:serine/threonine-protein kinase
LNHPNGRDGATEPQLLNGRYQIESELGHGGMAEVYLGTDRVLGRPIAVKILSRQFARDGSFVARFRREAQAAAALNHPNVVSVFDTGSDDGTHFIVMEFVQGKTLAQVIRDDGPLLPDRAAEIAQAVAEALSFAHRAGIIHRDVKPGNIMLTRSGDVKVMDFGIARATSNDTVTQTAAVLGTATYFSPEQAQGESVDARSDIYSLGVVLFEMLTGHPPFAGETPVSVAYKHVREDPVPPGRLNPDVPPELDAIVLKCLAKNPVNRYRTAHELAQDLGRLRSGLPVHATPLLPFEPTYVERATRATTVLPAETVEEPSTHRRWMAVLILMLILAILALGLFFLAQSLLGSPALVTVPDVRRKPVAVAQNELRNRGFVPVIGRSVANPAPKDTVIDYQPKQAQAGARIRLTVSTGPAPVEVPNVVCESKSQARSDLEGRGFKVRIAGTDENAICPTPGVVARQDPLPGEQIPGGSIVRLFLVPPKPSPSPTPTTPPPTTPSPPPTTPPPTTPPTTTPSPSASV